VKLALALDAIHRPDDDGRSHKAEAITMTVTTEATGTDARS
jgi:hypothetical protein